MYETDKRMRTDETPNLRKIQENHMRQIIFLWLFFEIQNIYLDFHNKHND